MSGEPGRAARGASLCGAALAAAIMLSATDATAVQDAAAGTSGIFLVANAATTPLLYHP